MNDFTGIFRKVVFEMLDEKFNEDTDQNDEKMKRIDFLFHEAFPTSADFDELLMSTINMMQFILGNVLVHVKATYVPGQNAEDITNFLNGMGLQLLADLWQEDR